MEPEVRKMRLHTILIKPASGLCNMRCAYCFYCDEMEKREEGTRGMMSVDTMKNLIKKAMRQAGAEICFAFQGGEPTLRGLDFFKEVIRLEERFNRRGIRVMNTLQTNGFAVDEEWCRFFKEHDFLIGLSVDGTQEIHDRYRHDASGGGTYARVKETADLFDRFGVEYNILTVVTRSAAEHAREIYREYKKNGWNYQQYIACLDPAGEEPGGREYSLTPEAYGTFLTELFQLWEKDWRKGRAPYIRQFENYIGILAGIPPEACEQRGTCSVQCVAEADGRAYPCDFYALDEYCLGNYNENSIEEFFESETAKQFVRESLKHDETCRQCRWFPLCRNGCRRHRIRDEKTGAYRNYFCGGYRIFFEKCAPRMKEIAGYLGK